MAKRLRRVIPFDEIYPEKDLFVTEYLDGFIPDFERGVLVDNSANTYFWQKEKYSNMIYVLSQSEVVEHCLIYGRNPVRLRDVFEEFNMLNNFKWESFEHFVNSIKDHGFWFNKWEYDISK